MPASGRDASGRVGYARQPTSGLQKSVGSHASARPTWKHAPSTQRAAAQEAAGASHSVSPVQAGSGQRSGVSGVHPASTQTPLTHASPSPQETFAQRRSSTTVTAKSRWIARSTSRVISAWPLGRRSTTRSCWSPGAIPVKRATRSPSTTSAPCSAPCIAVWLAAPSGSSTVSTSTNSAPGTKSVRRSTVRIAPSSVHEQRSEAARKTNGARQSWGTSTSKVNEGKNDEGASTGDGGGWCTRAAQTFFP